MAMQTANPVITEQINRWNVMALEVQTPYAEAPRMVVSLVTGYDGGGGVQWLREARIEVPADVLVSSWSAVVLGVSIFAAVSGSVFA
jgi:hypothetical protein